MKLSIIIPVFNEEGTLREIIRRVKNAKLVKKVKKEIIVIDDASTDKTPEILKTIREIKILRHRKNAGKGAAVRTGLRYATGKIILVQDADLEYDPNDYSRLIAPILAGRTQVVYGTRLQNYPVKLFGRKQTPFLTHYLGNLLLTFITNLLFDANLSDMETCYKVMHFDALKGIALRSNRFEFEPEITAKLLKRGQTILELPIRVKPRGYDRGKKITWKDGFLAIWTLLKYRFGD